MVAIFGALMRILSLVPIAFYNPAGANVFVAGSTNYMMGSEYFGPNSLDVRDNKSNSDQNSISLSQNLNNTDGGRFASASSSSEATPGILRLYSSSFASLQPYRDDSPQFPRSFVSAWSASDAAWSDNIVISSPSQTTGAWGTASGSINIDAIISTRITSASSLDGYIGGIWSLGSTFSVGFRIIYPQNVVIGAIPANGCFITGSLIQNNASTVPLHCGTSGSHSIWTSGMSGGLGSIPFSFDFQFGVSQFIVTEIVISTVAEIGFAGPYLPAELFATATVDMSQTALWGGISSISTQDGTGVFDFAVSAASGFDFTQPAMPGNGGSGSIAVPAPATLPLFCLAIIGFATLKGWARTQASLASR